MSRPKSDNPKNTAIQVRLDAPRLAGLDKLVNDQREALKQQGVNVTRSSLLRSLLDKAIDALT